jgi:hypothetical protein
LEERQISGSERPMCVFLRVWRTPRPHLSCRRRLKASDQEEMSLSMQANTDSTYHSKHPRQVQLHQTQRPLRTLIPTVRHPLRPLRHPDQRPANRHLPKTRSSPARHRSHREPLPLPRMPSDTPATNALANFLPVLPPACTRLRLPKHVVQRSPA